MSTAPKRCCAQTCYNTSPRNPTLKFFSFPANRNIALQWAQAAGRQDLISKSTTQLRRYTLCADHFTASCFNNLPHRTRFKMGTTPIPTIFENNLINRINTDNSEVSFEPPTDAEFHKLCRLCACLVPQTELLSLLISSRLEMIDIVLPGKVTEDTGLPNSICLLCEQKLINCFEIIQDFLAADLKLKTMHLNENITLEFRDAGELLTNLNYTSTTEINQEESLEETSFAPNTDDQIKCDLEDKIAGDTEEILQTELQDEKVADNLFSCVLCDVVFDDNDEYEQHCRSHDAIINIDMKHCNICGKQFRTSTQLRKHSRTHTSERNTLCPICGKLLANQYSLKQHLATHSNDRPFKCQQCHKSFKTIAQHKHHSDTHKRDKCFECLFCKKAFHMRSLLRQHQVLHLNMRPYGCNTCGAAFNRRANLQNHIKRQHEINDSTNINFQCPVCHKIVHSELTLKYHIAKHTGEKRPYNCDHCNKCFVTLEQWRTHARFHTGERPFTCSVCTRAFRSATTLKQHTLIHMNVFPHKCPFCPRSFKRQQSLIVHRKTHTGERPFPCSQCGRRFAQKGDMIKHLRTHMRIRSPIQTNITQQFSPPSLIGTDLQNSFDINLPIVEVETDSIT